MYLGSYLRLVYETEQQLADILKKVADRHSEEPDVYFTCHKLASWSEQHAEGLKPFVEKYSERKREEPDRLRQTLFEETHSENIPLLRNLHDVWLVTQEVDLCWKIILQAAKALRDKELEEACENFDSETDRQASWLLTRIKQAAPQMLVVPQ